jgi:cytochrome b pre-mRNA-processing protein 3
MVMLGWLTGNPNVQRKANELYGRVVSAARNVEFYRDFAVPDTPEGRFELVALHLFLAIERIKAEAAAGEALAQRCIEAFVTDMDDCLREMGVGDLTVPKKVKRAAAAFYERSGAYRAGLQAVDDDAALQSALRQYLYQGRDEEAAGRVVAQYVRSLAEELSRMSLDQALSQPKPIASQAI